MIKTKLPKKRVFLVCVVMAALLVVVGIIRMNRQESAQEWAGATSETLIQKYAKRQKNLKLCIAVIEDQKLEIRTYGKDGELLSEISGEIGADGQIETADGSGAEEILQAQYEIGSLTKTFTGALFGKYVSEGKVSLSDPVSRYIDFGGKYDPTLGELLTHTSAYADYRTNGFWQSLRFRFGYNPYKGIRSDKVPVFMRRFSAGGTAPYGYSFSNFGYAVLGKVIEAVEGRSAAEAIEAYAAELGLSDTVFMYQPKISGAWKWKENDAFLPAAGLSSDISDLCAFARLYFDDVIDEGRTLSAAPQKTAEGTNETGLGWGVRSDGVIGHGGETSKYSSQILLDSRKHRAVIVLSNRAQSHRVSVAAIAERIYGETFGTER